METRRFAALDGLRGICALIVLLLHVSYRFKKPTLFVHGFLSVDVFFLLSGFVLAFAFGDKLDAGWRAADFLRVRILRLGPVLWFAAGFSILGYFAVLGVSRTPASTIALAGLLNALLIPMTGASSTLQAFPLNSPTWSLFAEFWINVGFALVATRLTPKMLAALIVAGWAFLIVHAMQLGTASFGMDQSSVLYAIPRAAPSFACGVLIFKLWRMGALAFLPSIRPLYVFTFWAMICLCPDEGPVFDLVQIIVTAPLMLALLANTREPTPAWCLWLGRISYPLYATHAVIVDAGLKLGGGGLSPWAIVAVLASSLLLADILARWYEPAVRRLLQHRSRTATPFPQEKDGVTAWPSGDWRRPYPGSLRSSATSVPVQPAAPDPWS